MASKEQKLIKRFPKRLLSSFRRGKKDNLQASKSYSESKSARIGFTKYDIETAQNETAILDLDATLFLDSQVKSVQSDTDASHTAKRNLKSFLSEENCDGLSNVPTPQPRRLVLGSSMSASADSGIDCSILLADKSSPEQFLLFTRREAERLRQEQLHSSILETLNEVDRNSVEDTDSVTNEATAEHGVYGNQLEGAVGGYSKKESTVEHCDQADSKCFAVLSPSACDGSLGTCHIAHVDSSAEDTEQTLNSFRGDYVLLTENSDVEAKLIDATRYIASNKRCREEISQSENVNITNQSVNIKNHDIRLENEPLLNTEANVQNMGSKGSLKDGYMNCYANRTDEIKSAEARLRQINSSGAVLHLAGTHDIVNPIPVMSSSVATHRVIPSTPSPARLYVNENSAFAKCKSLKRSVSDVGKGILGRLRHRSKDGLVSKYENVCTSARAQETNGKKSGFTKLKKFSVRKEKQSSKVKYNEEKIKSRVRHKSEQTAMFREDTENMHDCVNYATVSFDRNVSKESPVMTECVFNEEKKTSERGNMVIVANHSPIYKEILPGHVKQVFEADFLKQNSPVIVKSVNDLTASISEMTTALCASSAESIACICDCKNRNSDSECCEKRKTPSPLEKTLAPSHDFSDNIENSHLELRVDAPQTEGRRKIESRLCDNDPDTAIVNAVASTEYSPQSFKNASAYKEYKLPLDLTSKSQFTVENDETSDTSTDDNDNSFSECSDLDCSNCCNASPNTGNMDFLSTSSDSECSLTGSCDSISLTHKDNFQNRNSGLSSESSASSLQNSESLSCSSCSEEASPRQGGCSFTNEGSPYSVSFREMDFENGDVMYVANNLSDENESCWMNHTEYGEKLSAACATPVSSPRVSDDVSLDSSLYPINQSQNNMPVPSQNACFENQTFWDEKGIPDSFVTRPVSQFGADRNIQDSIVSQCQKLSLQPCAELCPSPNISYDSSVTNVSFEGSFADTSFSVSGDRNATFSRNMSVLNDQKKSKSKRFTQSEFNLLKNSQSFNLNSSSSELNDPRFIHRSAIRHQNRSLGQLNDSRLLQSTLRRNHNHSINLNDSSVLDNSRLQNVNISFNTESTFMKEFTGPNFSEHSLNKSFPSDYHMNFSFEMVDSQNTSHHTTSPLSSPLDLSINKGNRSSLKSCKSSEANREWFDRHMGQIYSPAKRVLQKNRGLSESDLCKQILDLYVSDVDELEYDQADNRTRLNDSSMHSTDNSKVSIDLENVSSSTLEDQCSEDEQQRLQYGTYVAPRNAVKETNVDDFTTTTVWTCYSGEAKTRKLPGNPGNLHLRGEDRRRAALDELENMSVEKRLSKKKKSDHGGQTASFKLKDQMSPRREVLRDRTNTVHRLSALELASLGSDIKDEGVEQEIREERRCNINMNERSFDRLTMLHTVHNGQRKVRCLSMDESQNAVKYYPPPKEASRISWGQTVSEMDLYRHTPRKTPVKTRPILNQKENSYPYEGDTPSPIVLTKMRKPKSLAKKYKNWPWS